MNGSECSLLREVLFVSKPNVKCLFCALDIALEKNNVTKVLSHVE